MRKRIEMTTKQGLTFKEGCQLYIDDCKNRNLREATVYAYQSMYNRLFDFFDEDLLVTDFTIGLFNGYKRYLQGKYDNDVTIYNKLKRLITILHFLEKQGYMQRLELINVKVDTQLKETYTDEEIAKLLKKPNMNKCKFVEYKTWVMTNFLFTTGVRKSSLINIQIKDLDFDNALCRINYTKNRKALIIPLNQSLIGILKEYLRYRQHESNEDYLFCNAWGEKLSRETSSRQLNNYNLSRGVTTRGMHRWRHTFAKQWVLNGGNVVALSKLLGHSSLDITQNYINLLVSDLTEQVDEINLIKKFSKKEVIKFKR